ncbi:MAG: linear amide C-N hydrolase [Nostoc sp. SerVER01]|nr:linear amide C-N hydrolase [Nostoc sp. SerVER01]MDZ8024103.1 linear amide C-N hydrolase [Nostoc sp. DedQUE11]MDZ8077808.1 linear amide C-N hydrolase [Nostoc sp. DcaGUA01]
MKFNCRTLLLVTPVLFVGIAALLGWDFTQESFNIHQALSHLMNDLHVGLIPLLLLGCTRAIYAFDENSFITVRSMDWSDPNMSLSLWASPSGKERIGANKNSKDNPLEWESRYASVVVCNYGKATTDGMNEEGLVANLLFLPEAYYGDNDDPKNEKPRLAVSGWAQYILDKYATVKEAVEDLEKEEFTIVTDTIPFLMQGNPPILDPKGKNIVLHLSISDAIGDSAILQYLNNGNGESKLKIYHDKKYKVLTNSLYASQLEILKEFQGKEGWGTEEFSWDALKRKTQNEEGEVKEVKEMTPPMNGADIRFIRASFLSDNLEPISSNPRAILKEETDLSQALPWFCEPWSDEEGIARAFSLIRNMSTPLNVKSLTNPFLSSTLWRTVSDQKNKRLFLETARSIYPIYVDLPKLFEKIDTHIHKLVLLEPPTIEEGPRTELQEDQMKHQRKIGKVNDEFEPTDEWFEFDPK